jgi:hypothetical protein
MAGGWRRRVTWVAGVLVGLVALALVLPPLILRGRVLRWVAARATSGLCGEFDLGDGHLGLSVMPDVLLGRPFAVELDEAHIRAPDGTELIGIARVTARVSIARHPWRIVLDDAVAEHGQWKLVDGGAPGARFVDAFRQVPAGGSRASCGERRPPGHGGGHALSSGSTLVVRNLRLEEVDTELSFRDWGLKLPRARAHGTLAVGVPGSAGILFEARDVVAPGGSLRVGRVGTRGMTSATFDEVVISSVAAAAEHPTAIELTVGRARTGRSILSGKAEFEGVFPVPGRPRAPPGMRLEAKWTDTADVLARLEAAWLPPGATLEQVGLGGVITARLDGPYKALTGTITADGAHGHLQATMENGRRAAADVRADGIELAPLLDERLHALFAGRASGRLRARVELAARAADIEATIDEAEVSIDRAARGFGPRHVSLRVGSSPKGPSPVRLSTADTLALALERARLHADTLELDNWRLRWAGLSVRGRVALSLPATTGRLEATVDGSLTSLAAWVPPQICSARGSAKVLVSGPLDHLRAKLVFGPDTQVAFLGERFHAPRAPATATLHGREVSVSELRFTHDGGGQLAARVRGHLDRDLGGHLAIRSYPLSRVPAFGQIKLPDVLGAPRRSSLADVIEGTLDATLDVHGTLPRPSAKGTATVTGVSLAKRPLPDGRFGVHLWPLRATVDGAFGPTFSISGVGSSGPRGAAVTANVVFDGFAVAAWLPKPLDQLISKVTGRTTISVEPGLPPRAASTLHLSGPAGEVDFDGTRRGTSIRAAVRGHVELAGLRPVWSPALTNADGTIDVDLRGGIDYTNPRLDDLAGTVQISRALRVQPRNARLILQAEPGGRILVDGPRFSTEGLAVTTPGARAELRGEVRIDVDDPARSPVALQASGQLDAGALARRISIPLLASAAGDATFAVRARGEASAPSIDGQARFDGVELRPARAGWPTVRLDGSIEARGHTVSTRGLRVVTNPGGTLTIGGANGPASVEILSLQPPQLGRVEVPVTARGLRIGGPSSSLEIGALDLSVRLEGDDHALTLRGDVGIARARFDPRGRKPAKAGPSRPWFESLPPHLTLDLTLHGVGDAVSIKIPMLPDVSLAFACHVDATHQGARLSGRLHGDGLYSRMAVTVYDWFKSEDVRACRVIK